MAANCEPLHRRPEHVAALCRVSLDISLQIRHIDPPLRSRIPDWVNIYNTSTTLVHNMDSQLDSAIVASLNISFCAKESPPSINHSNNQDLMTWC